jgi:CHAD domain-containing protein
MVDKTVLRPAADIGPALRAVAGDMLARGRAAMTDPERPSRIAIHDFRRTMKQWRAFLRLLDPCLADARRWRDEARDCARALAGARDGQSALNAFEALVEDGAALPARSKRTIRARLEAIRAGQEREVLTPALRQDILDRLDAMTAAIAGWPLEEVAFQALAARLAAGYRAARRRVPPDWSAAGATEIHELRRRVVDHRYQVDLVEPLWPRYMRTWIEEAERLRDRLGKYQDLEMLERFAAAHQPLARFRARLAPACADRKAELVRRAARIAARLFAERPKAFRRRIEALWERGT